ncbi:hypothetical protein, partial [Caballeronia cordobensis]|uniref:hypothetical protein n=1 Tax=Caballeronia cordobensis TaxID=1353886 RepID=UPI001F43A030
LFSSNLLLFSVPLRTGRSLNVLTMINVLRQKPSSDTSCETLDTFAMTDPERPAALAIKRPHLSAVSF